MPAREAGSTKGGNALDLIESEVQRCRACDLWARATQGVAGDGPATARMMLVGEQPGDEEDQNGEPFVGPAGRLLDRALVDAGLDRAELYVTNAVKHFKWEPRGKRRIHQRPNRTEVVACRQWLDAEIAALPDLEVIVLLGATAGSALFGSAFRVGTARSSDLDLDGRPVVATIHPSAVLRAREPSSREDDYRGLVEDLRRAAVLLS